MIGIYFPLQSGTGLCCCGLVLLPVIVIIVGLYYFVIRQPSKGASPQTRTYDKVGTPSEDMEDEEETIQVDEKEHPSKVYSKGESSYDQSFDSEKKVEYQTDTMKTKEKSRTFLDKLLNRKEVCEECGTELEYRGAYESYYCPNCRTFK